MIERISLHKTFRKVIAHTKCITETLYPLTTLLVSFHQSYHPAGIQMICQHPVAFILLRMWLSEKFWYSSLYHSKVIVC